MQWIVYSNFFPVSPGSVRRWYLIKNKNYLKINEEIRLVDKLKKNTAFMWYERWKLKNEQCQTSFEKKMIKIKTHSFLNRKTH